MSARIKKICTCTKCGCSPAKYYASPIMKGNTMALSKDEQNGDTGAGFEQNPDHSKIPLPKKGSSKKIRPGVDDNTENTGG